MPEDQNDGSMIGQQDGVAETESAIAVPTKRFFVEMLTRDIDLEDAILDLLDNCLDGALRSTNGEGTVDYSKFKVEISLSSKDFLIRDNCGGIPRDVAKNYAFKMGREPEDNRDEDSETIGMYGVGMKRAMFKMGKESLVRTRHGDDSFQVPISSAWLELKEWKPLPIISIQGDEQLRAPGTEIIVNELLPGVSKHFGNISFVNDLRRSISEHFTMFLQHGLEVTVNGVSVEPTRVEVLVVEGDDKPAPYTWEKEIEGVLVSIVVGLNTTVEVNVDEDSASFEGDRSSPSAGWTVFCNDRAVIVGDKSRLTGWGDTLPIYHYQFSIITGIVEFKSNHAENLPITTTKRALDTASDVWLEALVKMKEGMRVWVNYTNAWKNHSMEERSRDWEGAKPLPVRKVVESVLSRTGVTTRLGAREYNPKKKKVIPDPRSKKPSSRRIIFSRPNEEIKELAGLVLDDENTKPSIVGETCFDLILEKYREQNS